MESIEESILSIVGSLLGIVWSQPMIYLFLGSGLLYTFWTRGVQVRLFKMIFNLLFLKTKKTEGVSSLQALFLSISGAVGTGNIAGVAIAIYVGGPGAVFWMWVVAFFGASTSFIENTLAQAYKRKDQEGIFRGGAAYYMERGLGLKWYGMLFALITLITMGVLLPGSQSNAITSSMFQAFSISKVYIGLITIFLLGIIIFGGIKRIVLFAEKIVPIMALFYLLIAFWVVMLNIEKIPGLIELIISSAFGIEATFGGLLGVAIATGVRRGIFSNEAGMGSATHLSSTSEVRHPAQQGLLQIIAIYFDTWVVCSATAFIILLSGTYNVSGLEGDLIHTGARGVEAGVLFTQHAIDSAIPGAGSILLSIILFFLAFTTLLAIYYMAEVNLNYFFKKEQVTQNKMALFFLKIAFLGSVFYSSIRSTEIAFNLSDLGVGLMTWLNLIAMLFISRIGVKILKDYEEQKKEGVDEPVFDPEKLGLKNMDYWKR